MVTCAACGRENPPDARFCNSCAAPLAAPEPRREERKVVTVLFADLVGFTSRAERMDPEDVRAMLAPYWEHLRSELERFGGTVEKFIGDAVMALFGAPVAHEDDPERAVRAALAIRDWVRETGEDLQVRIAVNTGEALVLLGARPAEGEGMAAGDVVNTAARLQTAAPVNGVLVGEATYRATRHVIEYGEAKPVVAKGRPSRSPCGRPSQRGRGRRSRRCRPRRWSDARTSSTCSSARCSACGASASRSSSPWRASRDRQEPARRRALRSRRGRPGVHHLAARPVALVRREREPLGARRDREGGARRPRSRIRAETAAKLSSALVDLLDDGAEAAWVEQACAPRRPAR